MPPADLSYSMETMADPPDDDFELEQLHTKLRSLLMAKGFTDIEEARALLDAELNAYNDAGQDSLGGLSPLEMHALLEGDWVTQGPMRINMDLGQEDVEGSDFLVNAQTFLATVAERGGITCTAAGNLPRAFVADMMEALRWPPEYVEQVKSANRVINEDDLVGLHILRVVLETGRAIRRIKNRFRVTGSAKNLWEERHAGMLYTRLFLTFFREFNLDYLGGSIENPAIQATIAYSFYRLSRVAQEWRRAGDLAPTILAPAALATTREAADEWHVCVETCWRILDPLVEFGLLEERGGWSAAGRQSEFRLTPLFSRFLSFEFTEPPRPPLRLVE